jgi:hypothetical protein
MATSVNLCNIWTGTQFEDLNNNLLAGGLIYTYEGGSFSVEQATYSENTGSVANPNPIVLDASGQNNNPLWMIAGSAYNIVLKDANNNILRFVVDYIAPLTGLSGSGGPSAIWQSVPAPTYVNATTFLVPGNYVTDFAVGNRVQFDIASGAFYGTVTAVSFSGGNTQVTLQNDSTAIDASLSAVFWSLNVVGGATVDAGAVSYTGGLTYSNPATVGGQLVLAQTAVTNLNNEVAGLQLTWVTAGTEPAYTITPSPAATAYAANMTYNVVFNATATGTPTLSVSGLGAIPLVQLQSDGSYTAAIITANLTTQVIYNGTNFVLQNPIPPPTSSVVASGNVGPTYYVKFVDGTIFQWGSNNITGTTTVGFAIAFTVVPTVTFVPVAAEVAYCFLNGFPTTSNFTAALRDSSSNPTNAAIQWHASGR